MSHWASKGNFLFDQLSNKVKYRNAFCIGKCFEIVVRADQVQDFAGRVLRERQCTPG